MVYKSKTNKRKYCKRHTHKNYRKKKLYGGLNDIQNSDDRAANNIMNQIEEQNKIELPNIEEIPVVGPVLEKTGDLVEGAAVKSLDVIGDSIGVDIDNPQSISEKLDNIKESLTDPKNVEKAKEILGNAGKYVEVGIEAAAPVIEKTADKILPVFTKEADKAVKAGLGTVVNVAEDLAGPFIGIPRTVLSAAEAFNASVNAGSELVKGTAEAIQGTQENFNRIINKNRLKIPEMPNMNIPNNNEIPGMPNNNDFKNLQQGGRLLKKYQNEAKMIGGRTNKSQLEFLNSSINLKQYGGKRNTKRHHYVKRKLTLRSYK